MENDKVIFSVPITFPIREIAVSIEYAETEKPSGITYLILTIVNEYRDTDFTMGDLMGICGVPVDLYHLFADEVSALIEENILIYDESIEDLKIEDGGIDKNNFPNMSIRDFVLTPMGSKIFADEVIPSKRKMEQRATIYYDPVDDRIRKTLLTPLVIESPGVSATYNDEKAIETWIDGNKNQFGIKTDQKILSVHVLDNVQKSISHHANVTLSPLQGICEITFDNKNAQTYFESRFPVEYIRNILLSNHADWVPAIVSEMAKFRSVYHPTVVNELLGRHYRILFSHKTSGRKADTTIPMKVDEFLFVGVDKEALGYRRVLLPAVIAGKNWPVQIPVITEEHVNYSALEPLAIESLLQKAPLDRIQDTINTIGVFASAGMVDQLISRTLTPDPDGIRALEQFRLKGKSIRPLDDAVRVIAKTWIDEWILQLQGGDWTNFASILRIRSILDWTDDQTLAVLADRIPMSGKERIPFFGRFMDGGFKETLVLGKLNVVPELVAAVLHGTISKEDPLTGTLRIQTLFRAWRDALRELNGLLKLTDPKQYVSKDNPDGPKIKAAFQKYQKAAKEAEPYRPFDPQGYEAFKPYLKIYEFVMDNFAQEDKAMQMNPDKITKEAVKSMLQSGQQFGAIVALTRKAEFTLKKLVPDGHMLEDLIDSAYTQELISKAERNDLHAFRRVRNKTVHYDPLNPSPEFDKTDLQRWSVLVFSLESHLQNQK